MSKSKISPILIDNIKVSYADSAGVLFENVSVSNANEYEKTNPGTTFLFLDGDQKYRYLNISQVNSLTVSDLITKKSDCDTSPKPAGPPEIVFSGGSGIGGEANPIIGENGQLLGIDIVNPGIGYEIPPIVRIIDNGNTGSGAVVQVTIKDGSIEEGIVLDSGSNYISVQPSTTPTIQIIPTIPIAELSATYNLNGSVTLTWNTDGATSLNSNFGQTILNGSVILSSTPVSQIFSITATNLGGSITKSVIVNTDTLLPGSTILGTIPGSQFGTLIPGTILGTIPGSQFGTLLPGTQQPGTIPGSQFGTQQPGTIPGSQFGTQQPGTIPGSQFGTLLPGTQQPGTIPGSQFGTLLPGTIPEQEQSYPVVLGLKDIVITNPGINYDPAIDVVEIVPNNGSVLQAVFTPFGQVVSVKVVRPGFGFTTRPNITIRSDSGINADFVPVFEIIRNPNALDLQIQQRKILTVIDIVGLQVQGFVGGKPYYGNVYYDNGVKYAGPYKSFDKQIRVYDNILETDDVGAQVRAFVSDDVSNNMSSSNNASVSSTPTTTSISTPVSQTPISQTSTSTLTPVSSPSPTPAPSPPSPSPYY
jgi:hypothetical protein